MYHLSEYTAMTDWFHAPLARQGKRFGCHWVSGCVVALVLVDEVILFVDLLDGRLLQRRELKPGGQHASTGRLSAKEEGESRVL
jgi:hypothetical protein